MLPDSPSSTIKAAHKGSIHTICYNSTGSYVLSGGQDRTICLWNSSTHSLIQTYRMHAHQILDLAVTEDSSKFASCGGDRTVFLWDVRTSKAVSRFSGHLAQVNAVAFTSNAAVLASGSYDGTVKLWDLRASSNNSSNNSNNMSKPIQNLSDAKDSVSAIDIYNHKIFTASVDGKLRTYDLRMGTLATDPVGESNAPLTSVKVLEDGEAALVASLDSKIRLIDLHENSAVPLQVLHGHVNESYRLKPALASNDTLALMPGEQDGRIYVWDLLDEKPMAKLDAHGGAKGFSIAVSPASGEEDNPGIVHWVSSNASGDMNFW